MNAMFACLLLGSAAKSLEFLLVTGLPCGWRRALSWGSMDLLQSFPLALGVLPADHRAKTCRVAR
ncbi:hypothetical protein [Cupriavidus alkaliphilus]|uniref:hypothetical protein n=1 Tax=Cupriavidus alkaliphilus TaxID=942866 RepID=UPI00160E970D|nr:hypothetical protein [Cupriavidus alkaliphilus]MBB3016654.1 hypothetical protein [Cupriavidus alkaliphilus]